MSQAQEFGYVNAFIEVGNEHRRVAVGGRRANNSTWAWLSCATADGSKAMRVSAEVTGPGLSSLGRRNNGDQRTAHFDVELPAPGDHVKVRIRENGARMADLARMTAELWNLKGAQQVASGQPEQGKATIEAAAQIVAELEVDLANLPDVELPGGITLKHALACVEFVRRLNEGQGHSDN
jgi:hypothetical protein